MDVRAHLVVAQQLLGRRHGCSTAQVPQLDDWGHVIFACYHEEGGQRGVPLH